MPPPATTPGSCATPAYLFFCLTPILPARTGLIFYLPSPLHSVPSPLSPPPPRPLNELVVAGRRARGVSMVHAQMAASGQQEEEVKSLYRRPAVPAGLRTISGDRAQVRFARENPAVTPRQASLFCRGDAVLGGGLT